MNKLTCFALFFIIAIPGYAKLQTPKIADGVLFISGKIDSHIYDYISFEYKKMVNVHSVDLNSLGGDSVWAIEIGRKIQELGLDTRISENNRCASACIYIFGSGKNRIIHQSVWLGIHGARISSGAVQEISSACRTNSLINSCSQVIEKWYDIAKDTTDSSFDLIESAGVAQSLREYYYSLEEEEDWLEKGNILKIRDLVLNAAQAKHFNLATDIADLN